jgi:L-fucose isomerase-like protein
VGSIWDLPRLKKELGIAVRQIPYKELDEEMSRVMKDPSETKRAERAADELLQNAHKSYIDRKYVVRSLQFHQTVENLMARHGCNAFTIECFELCSSKLPDQWKITPCLIHSLLRNHGMASSCEADLGSLLAMRLLMSVAMKSCHQGNSDPRGEGVFRINHSVPSMKMNGYDQPDVPYQLGRFVTSGWGTKVVVDFMDNPEKTVTVARVDPSATKLLVLTGELVGASGWGTDKMGCSVEALIRPPEGRADEFLRKRLEYGNHLQWVYGDYANEMQELGKIIGLQVEVIN